MLQRMWDRVVRGRRTVSETASDFSSQLPAVKLILFEWFAAEFAKNGVTGPVPEVPDSDISAVFAGQVVNFLVGDLFDPFDQRVPDGVRRFALSISDDIAEAADNLMKQDKNLREVVVYTLRMRLVIGSLQNAEFSRTTAGKRVSLLLQLYGGEFQENIDENRYTALVNALITWSKSPQFPGKRFA